jgi:flagellar biosynthesis protein FlhG
VRHAKPLLVESPGAKSAKNLERIVRRILTLEAAHTRRPSARPKRVNALNHYEVLETEPGASEEEIRRAYRRMRELFSADSLAMYALYDDERLAAAQARLTDAYDTLIDPSRRKPYDLGIFPDGNPGGPDPELERAAAEPGAPRPPLPELTADTEFSGAVLRQVRLARGIDLRDVTSRTKISAAYLRAIENEDFAALPALVYVRGFVTELAKVLHLDAPQVAKTFVRRFRKFLEQAGRAEEGEG